MPTGGMPSYHTGARRQWNLRHLEEVKKKTSSNAQARRHRFLNLLEQTAVDISGSDLYQYIN